MTRNKPLQKSDEESIVSNIDILQQDIWDMHDKLRDMDDLLGTIRDGITHPDSYQVCECGHSSRDHKDTETECSGKCMFTHCKCMKMVNKNKYQLDSEGADGIN